LATLEEHVRLCLPRPLEADYTYGPTEIFSVLLYAAAHRTTIEQACASLADAPHPNTVRGASSAVELTELEDQLNEALAHNLPKGLGQSPLEVALDLKLIPYWGEPQEGEEDLLLPGKPRRGTSTFFGYASLYVIKKNKRFTLAMVAVRRGAGTGRCLAPAVGTLAQAGLPSALSLPRPSVLQCGGAPLAAGARSALCDGRTQEG